MFLSERVPLCSRSVYKDHRSWESAGKRGISKLQSELTMNQLASWPFGPVFEYQPFRRFLAMPASTIYEYTT
jgi:hypothetical protein